MPCQSHKSSPSRRAAFSLVELLAVVAIIMILMALLIPMLTQFREQANCTTCMTKLRQIGIAFHAHMTDNDGRIPGGYGNAVGAQPWQKEYMGREVLDFPTQWVNASWPTPGVAQGVLIPYLGVAATQLRRMYRCPSMPPGIPHNPATGSNGFFDYSYFKIFSGAKLSTVPNKSTLYRRYSFPTPLLVEEDPFFYINNGNIDPGHSNVDRIGSWHLTGDRTLFQGGRGNYMAIDGHASSIKPEQIPNRAGSVNADNLLMLGPYANDWWTVAPSGNQQSIGFTNVYFGDWHKF